MKKMDYQGNRVLHQSKSRIILNDVFRAKIVADIDFNQENEIGACKVGVNASFTEKKQFIKTSQDAKEVGR